jgi:hypothetical protein
MVNRSPGHSKSIGKSLEAVIRKETERPSVGKDIEHADRQRQPFQLTLMHIDEPTRP